MGWRVVVVASNAKVDDKMDYLVVRTLDVTKRIHLSEISVLMLESTAISITAYAIAEMLKHKIKIIFCDRERNPCGEIMALHGSHDTCAKIRQQMKAAAQQELQLETAAMQAHLQEYLRQIMALFDYPAEVEQEGDIGAILKACGPRLSFAGANTAENLLDYMAVCQDLGGVRCFVLVNLKSYLAGNELQLFYEGICDRKLHVLLLESDQRETASEKENIRLIDKDFCELFLANGGEV